MPLVYFQLETASLENSVMLKQSNGADQYTGFNSYAIKTYAAAFPFNKSTIKTVQKLTCVVDAQIMLIFKL